MSSSVSELATLFNKLSTLQHVSQSSLEEFHQLLATTKGNISVHMIEFLMRQLKRSIDEKSELRKELIASKCTPVLVKTLADEKSNIKLASAKQKLRQELEELRVELPLMLLQFALLDESTRLVKFRGAVANELINYLIQNVVKR